jgi:hypothetical protein
MGYRDDLIERLKADGVWSQMNEEEHAEYEVLSDDHARRFMTMGDNLDMGDTSDLDEATIRALNVVPSLFRGALFQLDGADARLTTAGRHLGDLIDELRRLGMEDLEIGLSFEKLSGIVVGVFNQMRVGAHRREH